MCLLFNLCMLNYCKTFDNCDSWHCWGEAKTLRSLTKNSFIETPQQQKTTLAANHVPVCVIQWNMWYISHTHQRSLVIEQKSYLMWGKGKEWRENQRLVLLSDNNDHQSVHYVIHLKESLRKLKADTQRKFTFWICSVLLKGLLCKILATYLIWTKCSKNVILDTVLYIFISNTLYLCHGIVYTQWRSEDQGTSVQVLLTHSVWRISQIFFEFGYFVLIW